MLIRKAHLKDISQCVALSKIKEFKIPTNQFPNKPYLKDSLEQGLFFVAEESGKISGFILGFKLTQKEVYLDLLTVKKEESGKGIGKALFNRFRQELKKQKAKNYWLVAPSFNKKTLSFYRKLGLKEGKNYRLFCEKL